MPMARSCPAHPCEHPPTRRPIGGCVCGGGCYHRPAGPGESRFFSTPAGSAARFEASSSPATMAREVGHAHAANQPAAGAVAEKPAARVYRRSFYFAAFLLLADAALVALIIAFVPCLYSRTQTVLLFFLSTAAILSAILLPPCRHQDRLGRLHVSGTCLIRRFSWVKNFEFRTKE
jgi:hypothetical protein